MAKTKAILVKPTILSPEQIDRVRNLIHLGPLTWEPNLDELLVCVRLCRLYWPQCIPGQDLPVFRKRAMHDLERAVKGLPPIWPTPIMTVCEGVRRRPGPWYNSQGGIRAVWWRASDGETFKEHMTNGLLPKRHEF